VALLGLADVVDVRCLSRVSTLSITGLSPSLADHSRSFT
jgi:hypothetical protein